jgi:hypothetical protein
MKNTIVALIAIILVLSSRDGFSQILSGDQIDIYLRACSTGQDKTHEGDVGISALRNKIFSGASADASGKYRSTEIATILNNENQSDKLKVDLLKTIQECVLRYVNMGGGNLSIPIEIQQNFLQVISEIYNFKSFAKDAISAFPDRIVNNTEEYYILKDTRVKSILSMRRYAAFTDKNGEDISLGRVNTNNISVLCDAFKDDVKMYDDLRAQLRADFNKKIPNYDIINGVLKICRT